MAKTTDRPYVSFREVKERVPIPEVLEKLGIAHEFVERNGVYSGCCPIPSHQHGPRPNRQQFKINWRDGTWLWHCFGDCQRGGDVIELVKAVTGLSDEHVRFWFADNFGERLSPGKPNRRADDTKKAGGDHRQNHPAPASQTSTHIVGSEKAASKRQRIKPLKFRLKLEPSEYLRERGVSDETQATFGCGLCSRGYLQDYVAFPLFRFPRQDEDENPCGYIGRWPGEDFDADDGRPRYKLPANFEKSRFLFGIAEALELNPAVLVVVEGPITACLLHQRGFAVVSCLGSSLSNEQAEILIGTDKRIALCFDADEAGLAGMRTAAAKLITRCWTRVVRLPDGQQPDHDLDHTLKLVDRL